MSTRKDRTAETLHQIRGELLTTVEGTAPAEFVWEPRPGMKSMKALLQEIGTMERLHTLFLAEGAEGDWETVVQWHGDGLDDTLADLKAIRAETDGFLASCSMADFETPRAIPEPWQKWWGPEATPEAMLNWITMHEYYHLGQLVYNRWMLGHNPYEQT